MKRASRRARQPLPYLVATVLLLTTPLQAALPESDDLPPYPIDFALRFSRVRTPLGDAVEPSLQGNVGLGWQQPVSSYLHVGVLSGYTAVTQSDRPLTAGMRLEGYHAGVMLRGLAWPRATLQTLLEASYVYYHVDDTLADQSVALHWQETGVAAGGIWHAAEALRLFGKLHYATRDGQERAYGAINHTTDFNTHKTGGTVGLELSVDTSGAIGVQRTSGLHDGISIYFQRRLP